jgi:peptide/nickel transport system substrate-binding protein
MRTARRSLSLRRSLFPAILVVALGCSDRTARTPAADSQTPVQGGTVVLGLPGDFDNMNPLVSIDRYSQEVNREMLFLPLIRYSKTLDFEPALARSWKLLGDTGVVFYLRNDVKWTDGRPTTAADVLFTFERAKDSTTAYPNAEYFTHWKNARVIDSLSIQFTWDPHAEPLAGLPFLPVMPKHLLESIPPAQLKDAPFNKAPVGNGPFKFVEYRANDRWVFEANDNYPKDLGGRPYLDRVVFRIIPDVTAQTAEIQTGNVDIVLNAKTTQLKQIASNPDIRVVIRPSRQYAIVGWNGKRPPFDQPVVRRALSMAIDRQAILTTLRAGYGSLAVGPIGPYHWAFDSTLKALPFNPDSAKAMLKAAGIFDRNNDGVAETAAGKPMIVELMVQAGSVLNKDMAEMITANLAQVGVKIVVKPTEAGTMFGTISDPARKFDAVIVAWESDFRINLRDTFHSASIKGPFQLASYSNKRVDALIDSVSKVSDHTAARPLYAEIQRIIQEDQPWTFLYNFPDVYLLRQRVHGVDMDIRSAFLSVGKWWVTPSGNGKAAGAARSDSAAPTPAPDSGRSQ